MGLQVTCDPYSNPNPQELVQMLPCEEWGMHGFEQEEDMRPSFQGEEITSPINGSVVKWFNPMAKLNMSPSPNPAGPTAPARASCGRG